MSFLPSTFAVPQRALSDRFCLRALTIHDVVRDYDAVMSSREHLWPRFGVVWDWPTQALTIEQNLIDLGWHHKEFQRRSSFAYTVVTPDETRTIGCVYIYSPEAAGTDAEVWFWGRQSELASGLEASLEAFLLGWLASAWHFSSVVLNGRVRAIPGLGLPDMR